MNGIRYGLLHLHKALLDSERAAYEQVSGRVSPGELLQLLIQDPWFAWLRPFSETVVQIDEMLEAGKRTKEPSETLPTEEDAAAVLQQVRRLLKPTESEAGGGGRYYEALQKDPATVLAHAEVSKFLPANGEV
ncbi:MAG: hypothetical protein H7Z41_14520 [Cytophagales bacterium]|nr:hypothetical protein [Armatimonadota bacterium]